MAGLVHIYTGNGKGKTTAAIGLGIRASGRGLKVLMVQFLKGTDTGETKIIENLNPYFRIYRQEEIKKFVWTMTENELKELTTVQQKLFEYAVSAVNSGESDLLILDEIMAAATMGLVPIEEVIDFIKCKPEAVEVVLTGRNAPAELIELADYVSEIHPVKHPMEKGIPARRGIEF